MMRSLMSLVFVAGMLSTETALAQAPSVTGTWAINIPQVSGFSGNLPWKLTDAGTTFDGTMVIQVPPVAQVDGVMTARKVFNGIYIADASFSAKVLIPIFRVTIPELPTVKAILFVNGNTMTGLALQSINGVPTSVISVQGTRSVP
ncbi:MAG: hypothetical protein Q8K78_11625 [Planctomycetaceae bacterium]|nr:hypothetical protein [Planctomycetaceae bacterium]